MDPTLAREILDQLGPAESLPTIPRVIARGLELLEAEDIDLDSLTTVLGQDPSVASCLLKAANSVAMGGTASGVSSLREALMRLGLEEIKGVLVLQAGIAAFPDVACMDLNAFWRHSTATGVAAGAMAQLSPAMTNTESGRTAGVGGPYYLSGLFHDIGVLLCAVTLGERYTEVLQKNEVAQEPLWVTEESVLGFHHGTAGAALLCDWGLPELVYAPVEWHHVPQVAPDPHGDVTRVVHLADWVTHHFGIGDAKDGAVDRFNDEAWSHLGLELSQFGSILAATKESAEAGDALLQWVSK